MGELRVLETAPQRMSASVIETLEKVLEDAREGNVTAVGIAVVRPNGTVNTAFSQSDQAGALLGSVSLLQARMINAVETE